MIKTTKPNILLLIVDSLRVDHVSCYGYSKPTTPHIDELSSSSVQFDTAISPSGWTLPVFASILTGTYPSKNGVGQYVEYLPTIMKILNAQGYRSLVVTDNYFVQPLCKQADDLMYVTPDEVARMARSRSVRVLVEMLGSAATHKSILNLKGFAPNFLKNRLAEDWIGRQSGRGPWFAMIHYDVHWSYKPPGTFRDRFLDRSMKRKVKEIRRDVYDLISEGDLEDKIEVLTSLYDAQIAWVDSCIGNMLNHLKSLNMLDNTLTIVTSDHGDLLGEHGLLHHEFVLYEPLIRVPFIMRFPDRFHEGTKYSGLVQTIDILPTLIDYLGVETDALQIQGKSVLKLLTNTEHREFTISERADWSSATSRKKIDNLTKTYPRFNWRQYAHELVALRTEDHKYIWSSEGRDELYDLKQDPLEATNLISVEKEEGMKLRDRLQSWKSSFAPASIAEDKEFDSTITKRLRELGYL